MPIFTWPSLLVTLAMHAGPVEFLYYWTHRYAHEIPSMYKIHKHHHLSIVPTPKTGLTFLWSEHVFYEALFALPPLVCSIVGVPTLMSSLFYIPILDFVNQIGHINLEIFPDGYLDSILLPLFYCPSYHHVHHKYFKYNYALFMPIYDMMFGTYSEKYTKRDFENAKSLLYTKKL